MLEDETRRAQTAIDPRFLPLIDRGRSTRAADDPTVADLAVPRSIVCDMSENAILTSNPFVVSVPSVAQGVLKRQLRDPRER